MIHVTKLHHAVFETPNLSAMQSYYTDVLGFRVIDRAGDGTVYLAGPLDHHTVVLAPGNVARLRQVGMQLADAQALSDAATTLSQGGIRAETRSDPQPGVSSALVLHDTEETEVLLTAATIGTQPGFTRVGIAPEKLGHIALNIHDVARAADFYQQVLGFRVSDWIGDFFVFLRCGPDHHTMNFVRNEQRRMNHIAYQLHDWDHVKAACDVLSAHGIPLVWGPGRHGVGHNIFTYHQDPDGNIIELFAELDMMTDEALGYFEPRPWHEDFPQRPKVWAMGSQAIDHWGSHPPPVILG